MTVTEGWHPDPFGRHELRFHDGRGWASYVRDGDVHGMDDPVAGAAREAPSVAVTPPEGPTGSTAIPSASLLTATTVVSRASGDGRQLLVDEAGAALGEVRRSGSGKGLRVELVDAAIGVLVVGSPVPKSKPPAAVVRDPNGRELGRVSCHSAKERRRLDLVVDGRPVGRVDAEDADAVVALDVRGQDLVRAVPDASEPTYLVVAAAEPLRSLALLGVLVPDLPTSAGGFFRS